MAWNISYTLPTPGGEFALRFPSNVNGTENNLPYVALVKTSCNSDGLPLWGASNAGVTMIRRVKHRQQTGYYAQFWMCPNGTSFTGADYHGCHPYPSGGGGSTGTAHIYEIGVNSWDVVDYLGNTSVDTEANAISVNKTTAHTEIYIVTRANANSKTLTFYPDSSNTSSPNFVQKNLTAVGYGEGDPAIQLVIGDSPWFATFQNERASFDLDSIKIFSRALSLSDALSEAASMDTLATADGQAGIWWGKYGFDSVDDLTCDFGTTRSLSWGSATKATTTARL